MKRFFIMTLIISMFALAGCTTTTDDGNTNPDSENTSQENTNQNDQNTENENKNEENDTPAQPTLTGSTLDSITIKTPPAKTEYTAGEIFDPAGLALTANYTDTYSDQSTKSSAKDLAYADIQNDLTFTGTDFAEAGTATVTVTYKGKNVTFSVKVTEKPAFPTIGNYKITGEDIIISDFSDITVSGSSDAEFNIFFLATKQTQLSLPEISNIAKAFPNATITADDKISYTINGGTTRDEVPSHIFIYKTLTDNEFKDLTAFAIDGKISIDETTDIYTHEEGEPTKIRTITLDNGTTLNITGKFLDIGRNRFKVINNAVVNLSDDIEITTYNSEISSVHHTYITSDIAKTQFDALGVTTPNFDLAISDENLYNFAHDILDRYDSFDDDDANHKVEVSTIYDIDGSISGKSLYTDNELNSDVPSLKFSSIKKLGYDVKNTKITGDVTSDTTTDINFTNVVFTGDVSGLHNDGTYEGVIHFKDEPMKDIYSEYALIKIDTPPTGEMAKITGGIMDFRDMSDDLTSDSDYDIGKHLKLQGSNIVARGYFKDETQKNNIAHKLEGWGGAFADTYFEPVDKEYMKTLSDVEKAANEDKLRDLFNNHPKSTEAQQ